MARKSGAGDAKVRELLRMGGAKVPGNLLGKVGPATQKLLRERAEAASQARRAGAKLLGGLKGTSAVDFKNPANKKSLDEMLNWHKKLASKKPAPPKVGPVVGGLFPFGFSETIVPPFDFAQTFETRLFENTNADLAVSANTNGQMSASAVTSKVGQNGGSEYARVGVLFHPVTQGTLRVWTTPTYSFEWWTNSLNTSAVRSFGSVELAVYGMDLNNFPVATAGVNAKIWDQSTTGEIDVDAKFELQTPLTTELAVNSSLIYLIFVAVDAHVEGSGWPGSLAGAVASATLPSIRYEFEMTPLIES